MSVRRPKFLGKWLPGKARRAALARARASAAREDAVGVPAWMARCVPERPHRGTYSILANMVRNKRGGFLLEQRGREFFVRDDVHGRVIARGLSRRAALRAAWYGR